jgi:hypothetical protein
MDFPSPGREHRHRHNPDSVRLIIELLAIDEETERAVRREGWLHLFMDWGILQNEDWMSQ